MNFLELTLILFFLISGCSPNSLKEYQTEGEALAKLLISELREVESTADLLKRSAKVKKIFSQLTELMICAKTYQMKHPEEQGLDFSQRETSEILQRELMRIYQIDGCQDLMEDLQRESLHRLDLFHKKSQKLIKKKGTC